MRIVLDTNVLVSSLLNPEGNPGRVLDLFLAGDVTLLVDDRILAEYRVVLARPKFGFDAADISDLLELIESESERVAAPPVGVTLSDASDLPFLEVGIAGNAEVLITGNIRHFRPTGRITVSVATPADFIRRWRQGRRG